MNRVQVQHVVLSSPRPEAQPEPRLFRHVQNCPEPVPNLLMRSTSGAARLYPISSNITTADSHAGTFSAACAVDHLARRRAAGGVPWLRPLLRPDGQSRACRRAGAEGRDLHRGAAARKKRELLASRDDWTRPVFLESGPDGALYVCDMYRRVIEHPDYLSAEMRKHTNFRGRQDDGAHLARDEKGREVGTGSISRACGSAHRRGWMTRWPCVAHETGWAQRWRSGCSRSDAPSPHRRH